jgi:hypothetical protein
VTTARRMLAVLLTLLPSLLGACSSSQGGDSTTTPGTTAAASDAHRATGIVYTELAGPPAGTATSDLMLVGVIGQGVSGPPPGWTPIGATTGSDFDYQIYYAWRIRQPGDSSYTFPNAAAVQIAVYVDVDPAQPLGAFRVARHQGTSFDLGTLTASDVAGDAAHYQSLGVLHGVFTPPAGYTERQDGADATTAGDRLALQAGQGTGGTVQCTDDAQRPLFDDGVHLHAILRARRRN